MAYKTLLRQLISKYGVMSIEMETAYKNDMAEVSEAGVSYVDNPLELKEQVEVVANKQTIPTEEPKVDDNGLFGEEIPLEF